ncbi:MAG: transporter related protein [Acidimicrobiales bacterium]|nr:transporter related protein [Acidimicrobiales bacterium]
MTATATEPEMPLQDAPADLAIATKGLTKRLSGVAVVDGLDLAVPRGSVFGFLGPNGSGKTTTIRMLLGLIAPSAGEVRLLGQRLPSGGSAVLPDVGALVEGPAFYPWLSGRDNLARYDRVGRDSRRADRGARVDSALERVGLSAAAGKRYRAYSLGMRQRLGLAAALLRPRRLFVLDEPTNGMDPQGTREIRHLIRDLAAEGGTVFLSSHLLGEIEQVCTHAAIINLGRLLTQGPLHELQALGPVRLRVETDDVVGAAAVLQRLGLLDVAQRDGSVLAGLDGRVPEDVCRALVLDGIGVREFVQERPSLEDAFVSLTGEGFDVAR